MSYTKPGVTTQNTLQPLLSDLHENVLEATYGGDETQIIFVNPVTGHTSMVIAEHPKNSDNDNDIVGLFYVERYRIGGINEEIIIHDRNDLYDMILIDDEDGQ